MNPPPEQAQINQQRQIIRDEELASAEPEDWENHDQCWRYVARFLLKYAPALLGPDTHVFAREWIYDQVGDVSLPARAQDVRRATDDEARRALAQSWVEAMMSDRFGM